MNFNSLEKNGRVDFQCSFTNDVIIIYNSKLGSRFIDGSMGEEQKYHVVIDLSKAPNIQVQARPIYYGKDSAKKNSTAVNCEETSKFLKSVFVGKSNKRDVIFVYRDPWEKYKSGIYQDYPSRLKPSHLWKVLKYFDTLILEEQTEPREFDTYFNRDIKGAIFTGHSQRILITYKAILNKTNIDINRCKFFNMGIYELKNALEMYGLVAGEKHSKNRSSWTENKNFREFFYDTFESSRHRKVVKKIMKEEMELYKWFESHNRNFTNLHKATIKK